MRPTMTTIWHELAAAEAMKSVAQHHRAQQPPQQQQLEEEDQPAFYCREVVLLLTKWAIAVRQQCQLCMNSMKAMERTTDAWQMALWQKVSGELFSFKILQKVDKNLTKL